MKKIVPFLIAATLLSGQAMAQGFYFNAGLGYAMPFAGQTTYNTPTPYNGNTNGYSGTSKNTSYSQAFSLNSASFATGMKGGLGIGYLFSEHVGLQLDASFSLSNIAYTYADKNVGFYNANGTKLMGDLTTTQTANSPFFLMPSLLIQSGGEKLNLYTRMGVALPISSRITLSQDLNIPVSSGSPEHDIYTWEIKSSFSLGLTGALGVKYKINDRLSAWGELSMLSMSLYTKEMNLTGITANGVRYSPSAYSGVKTITFSKTTTVDTNFNTSPAYAQPFSNVGINFGVSFSLSQNSGSRHASKNHSKSNNSFLRQKRDDDSPIDSKKRF